MRGRIVSNWLCIIWEYTTNEKRHAPADHVCIILFIIYLKIIIKNIQIHSLVCLIWIQLQSLTYCENGGWMRVEYIYTTPQCIRLRLWMSLFLCVNKNSTALEKNTNVNRQYKTPLSFYYQNGRCHSVFSEIYMIKKNRSSSYLWLCNKPKRAVLKTNTINAKIQSITKWSFYHVYWLLLLNSKRQSSKLLSEIIPEKKWRPVQFLKTTSKPSPFNVRQKTDALRWKSKKLAVIYGGFFYFLRTWYTYRDFENGSW